MKSLLRALGLSAPVSSGGPAGGTSCSGAPAAAHAHIDLSYISPRIIACGRPSARETDIADHRNSTRELAAFLNGRHPDNYLVINLSNKDRSSIDYSLLKNSVAEFQPASRGDVTDDTPAIGQVFRLCYCLKFFLDWGPETAVVLHCNNGVLRTGFMIAAFLVYTGRFGTMEEALAFFSARRIEGHVAPGVAACAAGASPGGDEGEDGGAAPVSSISSRFLPSWRFLMREIDRMMCKPAALPAVFTLAYVVLTLPGLPDWFGPASEASGRLRYPQVQLYEGSKLVFDSLGSSSASAAGVEVRWEDGQLVVEVQQLLCGDYQLWVLAPPPPRGAIGLRRHSHHTPATADGADGDQTHAHDLSGASAAAHDSAGQRHIARFVFHSSCLAAGINTFGSAECDVFRRYVERPGFRLCLLTSAVSTETVLDSNIDKALKRSFVGLRGAHAIVKGAEELSAHHYTFPDARMLKTLIGDGFDETAAVCALQRSGNAMGRTREYLDSALIRECFREPSAMRDLRLLRETLSSAEVAGALSTRANMIVKQRGIGLDELDYKALLDVAKLGTAVGSGEGLGPGSGVGSGGTGGTGKDDLKRRPGKGKRGRLGKRGGQSITEDSEQSDASSSADDEHAASEDSGDDDADSVTFNRRGADEGAAPIKDSLAPKLFEGECAAPQDGDEEEDDAAGDDGEEEEEEEEEVAGPWLMADHPVLGRFFAMLAAGKPREEVLGALARDRFNPALLDLEATAPVPDDLVASLDTAGSWEFLCKYSKMLKVGLPRPVVEHKMLSEGVAPALLDADPAALVLAGALSPPRPPRKGGKKPGLNRKKLHWVPIALRGRALLGTIWEGPPADLVAAAAQLIDDEAEFTRLFIQNPEDLKKAKKGGARDSGVGLVQLLDPKRAMNCGIALAKLRAPFAAVAECLRRMCARTTTASDGRQLLLTAVDITNLLTLCPTDEERAAVSGYRGDAARLARAEQFMLAVADVPQARQRAEGLRFQASFDERAGDVLGKLRIFGRAVAELQGAPRLRRFLKAVLVLGNKLNGAGKKGAVVRAFTVNSLHQLHLTKSFGTDAESGGAQTSVLEYLVALLRRKDPELLRVAEDFPGDSLAQAKRVPLELIGEDVRELRAGLTSLEAVVREAAQAGAGWSALTAGGGSGATYVEEELEEEGGSSSGAAAGKGKHPGSAAASSPAAATTHAGAAGGDDVAAPGGVEEEEEEEDDRGLRGGSKASAPPHRRCKKTVRRRVEPLPEFAALAQAEVADLERQLDTARGQLRAALAFWHEEEGTGSDALFGGLHMFLSTLAGVQAALADRRRKARASRRRAKAAAKGGKASSAKPRRHSGAAAGGEGSGGGGKRSRALPHHDSSSIESDSSGSEAGAGAAGPRSPPAWAAATTAAAAGSGGGDDDDDDDDVGRDSDGDARPANKPSAPPDARASLLAAISGKQQQQHPQATTATAGASSSSSSDPRGGLLAAIKAKHRAD